MEGYLTSRRTMKEKSEWESVTLRECDIQKLVAATWTEVCNMLNISVKTVEKHRANIMNKLDLHNVAALTSYAIEKGLVEPKA